MKRLVAFSLSFALSFIAFLIVAFAVLLFSGSFDTLFDNVFGNSGTQKQTQDKAPQSHSPVVTKSAELLLILESDSEDYISIAKLYRSNGEISVSAEPISINQSEISLLHKEQGEGFAFIGAVLKSIGKEKIKFIKFSKESFAKITDRLQGVVYNKNNKLVLLTGWQAVKEANDTTFPGFCEQLLRKALSENERQEFLALVNSTVNNLSYPAFYEFCYQ